MKLTIRQPSLNPRTCEVHLAGVKLTSLLEMTIEWHPDRRTTATLTLGVDDLDVDAESAAHLIAMIREAAIRGEAERVEG